MLKVLTTAIAIVGTAVAHVERAPELSCGWREISTQGTGTGVGGSAKTKVTFALHVKESNLDEVKRIALEVSDPSSSQYGEHLSPEALAELTAPAKEDVDTVRAWVQASGGLTKEVQGRRFEVTLDQTDAEKLLNTKFRSLINVQTGQRRLVASDYTLPADVHKATAAVFGLHGLPLPSRKTFSGDRPGQPADVTPAVITQQYGIKVPTADKKSNNKQAVAEFQGQTMSSTDLEQFFKQYVPNAPAGSDKVSKFVGDPGDASGQTEASLDIQYIMGVAPGVPTEFWYYKPSDFCADLKNWTSMLLAAGSEAPLVTSVSYGWQGDLSAIGCKQENVDAVDADFAKLAASGITIIFASGDSGSGYANHPSCEPDENVELQGTIKEVFQCDAQQECCFRAQSSKGWTYDGPGSVPPSPQHCQRGTSDTALKGFPIRTEIFPDQHLCCEISDAIGVGYTFVQINTESSGNCTIFKNVTGTVKQQGAISGQNPPRQTGNCTVYSDVTGKKNAKGKSSGVNDGSVQLWPSWPASSPWVTSVGATRFVGQKAGNEEMATDQFGSGGGFSAQFNQTHAKWQSAAVSEYLKIVPKGSPFPPSSSIPTNGRGTPDVAALGEGFQVLQNARVMSVGGTSASAPTFAAVVSLLNEHQLQNGGKPLGFLNPWLFQNPSMFTDVTKGTNAIGRGTGPLPYGYNCTKAWDPATGLGTPIFGKMVQALPSNGL